MKNAWKGFLIVFTAVFMLGISIVISIYESNIAQNTVEIIDASHRETYQHTLTTIIGILLLAISIVFLVSLILAGIVYVSIEGD